MIKYLIGGFLILSACCLKNEKMITDIYFLSVEGNYQKIGVVEIQNTLDGLLFQVDLKGLPTGEHGFHIHENDSCAMTYNDVGKVILAGAAGSHYDPQKTNRHLGPNGAGHKGDLPFLKADEAGRVKTSFYNYQLSFDEIKNKSLVIHKSGDNYSDMPKPLGGGGDRIACGVIR